MPPRRSGLTLRQAAQPLTQALFVLPCSAVSCMHLPQAACSAVYWQCLLVCLLHPDRWCGCAADIYGPSEHILGDFAREWSQAGNAPVQLLTKYVPNIFQEAPTPHSIEEAIRRSMASLKVIATCTRSILLRLGKVTCFPDSVPKLCGHMRK